MKRFWERDRDPVDAMLRSSSPRATDELVDRLGERVIASSRPGPRRLSRAAFGTAFAVFMLGSFASFGGIGYAAQGAESTVHTMKRALAPAKSSSVQARTSKSAAQDQYGEEEVEEKTVTKTTPPAVVKVAGATGGTPAAATTDTLPFTGIGLGATAAVGSLLLAFGMFLRRRESQK